MAATVVGFQREDVKWDGHGGTWSGNRLGCGWLEPGGPRVGRSGNGPTTRDQTSHYHRIVSQNATALYHGERKDKMSNSQRPGTIGWLDLTVENAPAVRDFYAEVVGWKMSSVSQGDYDDYCAHLEQDGPPVAGICHARGDNSGMPPHWIMYVTVADLDHSLVRCEAMGGAIVCPMRDLGSYGRVAVIRDPAGAVLALIQPPG